MEAKGNKILCNTKSKWISMISLVKYLLFEYHIFFMKMALDASTTPYVGFNFSLFIYVETLLGLNVMMPLLYVIHFLIKFAQLKDFFVFDCIVTIKICEGVVYCIYCIN